MSEATHVLRLNMISSTATQPIAIGTMRYIIGISCVSVCVVVVVVSVDVVDVVLVVELDVSNTLTVTSSVTEFPARSRNITVKL